MLLGSVARQTPDGKSILPVLKGESKSSMISFIGVQVEQGRAIRSGKWKLKGRERMNSSILEKI